MTRDFLGPLASLSTGFGDTGGARRVLEQTGFAHGAFRPRGSPVALCFMPFQWEAGAPELWLVTTLGLSDLEHQRRLPQSPARLELCAAWVQHESEQPLREMLHDGVWDLPGVPVWFRAFHALAMHVRTLVSEGSSLWFGDTLTGASWLPHLPHGLLAPPLAEFVVEGLTPWRRNGTDVERLRLDPGDALDRDALTAAHDSVFMQYVPLHQDEFVVAEGERRAWPFFLDGLLASDDELELGLDLSAHVVNLERPSRLAIFRSSSRR